MPRRDRRRAWFVPGFLTLLVVTSACRGGEPVKAGTGLPGLVLIAPGTHVGDAAPRGWSHLVVKSVPKLESGDLDTLPSFAATTATLFRTVILADVRPSNGGAARYALSRVGLGLAVPAGGQDTVVTHENASSAELSLGFVERKVFDRAEAELKKARLVARRERFAVLAAPSELLVDGRHEGVYLFYALTVDPDDGRLSVFLWAYTNDPARKPRVSPLSLLTTPLVYRCGLDVQAERLLGALPVNWSFAMRSVPPGKPLAAADGLRRWLTDPKRIAAAPEAFEALLRADLTTPPRDDRAARAH
jgi:hypothetical protein